ncbi:MAG: minor capsid protein [Undibacterium sp.]
MIWDILVKKIEDAGLGIAGESIFVGNMPAGLKSGVMIKFPLSGIDIDYYIPGYFIPDIQIIVRNSDPYLGEKIANDVMKAVSMQNQSFPATFDRRAVHVNMLIPSKLPIRFPALEGNSIEFSLNFISSFSVAKA